MLSGNESLAFGTFLKTTLGQSTKFWAPNCNLKYQALANNSTGDCYSSKIRQLAYN